MKDPYYDVIIVGGSFAGGVAANVLKRSTISNWRILVIDLKPKPGYPQNTTGGVAKFWFDKVGFEPPWETIAADLHGVELVAPGGKSYTFRQKEPVGYVLWPSLYVQWLMDQAMDGNNGGPPIDLISGTRVISIIESGVTHWISEHASRAYRYTVQTDRGHVFHTSFIIGADGHGSNVGKMLGMDTSLRPEDTHIGLEYVIENDKEADDMIKLWFTKKYAPFGYVWCFPDAPGRIRLGCGIPRSVVGYPKYYLDRFIEDHREYQGQISSKEGGIIPTAPLLKTATPRDGIMLVGDAAHFCSPLHGGGIWFGMLSAKLAAESIMNGEDYDKAWKREIAPALRRHYRLKKWIYRKDERDFDRLINVLQGYTPKSMDINKGIFDIAKHMIVRDPLMLLGIVRALI